MRYVLATALGMLSFMFFQAAAEEKHECDKDGVAHKVDCLIRHVDTLEKQQKPAGTQVSIGCVKSGTSGLCAIIDETGTVTFFDASSGVQGHYKMEGMTVPVNVSCFEANGPEGSCIAVDAVGKKWTGSARGANWHPF